jgi:hypothetical protein
MTLTPFSQFVKDNYKKEDLIGVEIGVWTGINAGYLLGSLPIKKLYLVDSYQPYFDGGIGHYSKEQMDSFYATMMMTLVDTHWGFVMPIINDSVWASKLFPNNYFDFVYIDAGHSYNDVMADMNAWWPRCKSGAVFGGHDYGTVNGAEVKRAVDDFIKEKGILVTSPAIGMRVGEAMEWAFFKP